jgi:hypothetical protein
MKRRLAPVALILLVSLTLLSVSSSKSHAELFYFPHGRSWSYFRPPVVTTYYAPAYGFSACCPTPVRTFYAPCGPSCSPCGSVCSPCGDAGACGITYDSGSTGSQPTPIDSGQPQQTFENGDETIQDPKSSEEEDRGFRRRESGEPFPNSEETGNSNETEADGLRISPLRYLDQNVTWHFVPKRRRLVIRAHFVRSTAVRKTIDPNANWVPVPRKTKVVRK